MRGPRACQMDETPDRRLYHVAGSSSRGLHQFIGASTCSQGVVCAGYDDECICGGLRAESATRTIGPT